MCKHEEWEYDIDGERWIAENVEAIHAEATCRWCSSCGELWFREGGGPWFQKFWTAAEIEEIKERADELSQFFDLDERGEDS